LSVVNGQAGGLIAPAAVRLFDLEKPLPDLSLGWSRLGERYRSLLAFARIAGDPIGAAVVSVEREGSVSRDQLALQVHRQLEERLCEALARSSVELPHSLTQGIAHPPGRGSPEPRPRSVSVVVSTCRNPYLLRRCLRSILGSDYDDFEVIVIENRPGSPDTRRMLTEEFGDHSRVRYGEETARGLASARNAGLALAAGELVAFTDDDVVVDPCWIRRSAEAFDCDEDVACVTGLILPLELETEAQLLLEQFMTLEKGFSRQSYRLPETRSEYPLLPYTPGVIGSGANTVLRADIAERLGGFDADLGTGTPAMGGEDLDLYIRLLLDGHTVQYEPSAIVWHAHPEGVAKVPRQVYRYGVGLGAPLTKQLIAGPDRHALLRAVPAGIRYLRDPTSRKNAGKPAGYPRRLDWLERMGMLVGPAAYLMSLISGLVRIRRCYPASREDAERRVYALVLAVVFPLGAVLAKAVGGPTWLSIGYAAMGLPAALLWRGLAGRGRTRPRVGRGLTTPPARRGLTGPQRRDAHGGDTAPVRRGPRAAAGSPSADRAVLTALFVVSLAVYVGARAAQAPNVALGAELGVMFFGVGTAPLQLSPTAALPTRLGVAALFGLSTVLLVGAVMVLGPLWHPEVAAILLLVGAGAAHAIALPSALTDLRLVRARRPPPPRVWARFRPSFVLTLAGTSLWLGSAIVTGYLVPGIGGFPAQITPVWYGGVALVLTAITFALREKRERYAAIAVGSLVLALTLTPALVYGVPRAQWAAKHVEFVHLISSSHHLDTGAGIYSAYSGFFAGTAWLCHLGGVSDAIGLARFWPVVIALLRLAALRFLVGRVIEGTGRRWAAITLVVLVDAFGMDYFSPQSVGYVMALGIFALAIRATPVVDRRLTAALLVLSGCALAVTHQISPYIAGSALLILAAFRCARPQWAALAVLIPAGLWAVLNREVLNSFVSLSSLGHFSNFSPPPTDERPGLGRHPIIAETSYALTLGMLVLVAGALIGFARHWRERWALAYLGAAGAGLLVVAMNPYGNEAIFRASLFGIPWLALLAVQAVRRPHAVLGQVAWMAVSLALFGNFLVAAFGMDATRSMRRADLHAMRIFNREAPSVSYLLQVGFGDLPSGAPDDPAAHHQITFREVGYYPARLLPERPRAADLAYLSKRFERYALGERGTHTGHLYAIWSPVSSLFAFEYGLQSPKQSAEWRDLLLSSPSWALVYHSDGTYLFRKADAALRGGAGP
jgi:GT2 family glycosyltransferase